MTRFKELSRIRRAIESDNAAELQWAKAYCRSRLAVAPSESQKRYWNALLREISGGHHHRQPNEPYQCGLAPGDQVRLRKELIIRNARGKPTSGVYSGGEIWTVVAGSCSVADDVWFRTPVAEDRADLIPQLQDLFVESRCGCQQPDCATIYVAGGTSPLTEDPKRDRRPHWRDTVAIDADSGHIAVDTDRYDCISGIEILNRPDVRERLSSVRWRT